MSKEFPQTLDKEVTSIVAEIEADAVYKALSDIGESGDIGDMYDWAANRRKNTSEAS